MTEERKKALAEKTTLVLMECDFNASKELAVVTKLIEIVAAEAREEGIEEIPLRAVLDWYMCSDPWLVLEPYQNQETVTEWLDGVCKARGYKDWVEAYHKMPAERLKGKG